MANQMTAAQWLVLDNVKHGWPYATNLSSDTADEAYLWCVRNEYIKDARITPAGEALLRTSTYVDR
jgi:hypothetical protein